MRTSRLGCLLLSILVCCLGVGRAEGAEPGIRGDWTVLPFDAKGLDEADLETFQILLVTQIANANPAGQYVEATGVDTLCRDARCAAAQITDVAYVFFGSIRPLGAKLFVTVTLAERDNASVLGTYQLTIRKAEELEAVANRIAKAVATGTSIDETVDLENVVSGDSQKYAQREGRVGFGFRPAFIAPLRGFANAGPGVGLDISVPYELANFMIEPRLGFRWDANTSSRNEDYFMLPFDVGAFYLMNQKDFTPYVGGGLGLRYLRVDMVEDGRYYTTEWDSTTAIGGYARLGVLMFRTYGFRLNAYVEIDSVFSEVHDVGAPTSVGFALGMIFGAR